MVSAMMATVARAWDRCWFQTTARYQYGLFRIILVGGYVAQKYVCTDWWDVEVPPISPRELMAPSPLLRWLHLPYPLPVDLVTATKVALAVLVLAALFGVVTRVSVLCLALLNLYLDAVVNSYGLIDHTTSLPDLALLILALAPNLDTFSVDALIRRWRRRRAPGSDPDDPLGPPAPIWPARLILVVIAFGYFTSGYSKLRYSGISWVDGQTLTAYSTGPDDDEYFLAAPAERSSTKVRDGVGLESFLYSTGTPTNLGRALGRSRAAMVAFSIVTLFWELTFPLALFSDRLRRWYLLAGIGFHVGVKLTLTLTGFLYYYPVVYALFLDHRGWIEAASRRLAGAPRTAPGSPVDALPDRR